MKIALTVSFGTWKQEFYWGKTDAKYALVEVSGIILTVGFDFAIKV